ncbi:Type 1 glutamine amidotransferase-like domain-containing protein [Simiduia sp. 21SJ11W-1]|uniref:Type 1 glutamine amidotransferase-like domain-containing protein n=1 Tax=Simiduia sp. 21SJ11W-1 TaxID=2909669 RepID=UPI0020A0CA9B|nr:Type 1 glutamine amidotransferase-like domain-containing protein [Simiduia sp. 21SJ11W-1]UTA47722.1 Type 1 glutamine amidotransferase-like domain-containing protein [Simiduia sp. 21SJ11W-1]
MKTQRSLIASIALGSALFSFGAQACITTEAENNNSDSNANGPVCSDQAVQGAIGNRRDVDWFYFDVDSATNVNVSLSHSGGDDFDWLVYPASGGALGAGESSNNPETGTVSVPSGGRYYVKVVRYKGTGSYQLSLTGFDGSGGGTGGGGSGDCGYGDRPNKPGPLSSYLVGNGDDQCVSLNQGDGGLLLMGGGTDVDAAFSNRVTPKIGGGDIVVLRTSGTDAYNTYLQGLTGADSVETLIVDRRSLADDPYVIWAVESAEFVWIAGGDQSDYLNQWAGTGLRAAIDHVYQKGGIIGGTSAGNAVQSEFIYDPDGILGVYSDEAVTDLCHEYINISSDFLTTPIMQNVITDTHFAERDRMGRLMVFMANLSTNTTGIGVDEATAIYFGADGQGVVDGAGNVYVLRENSSTQRTQTQCGQAVIYESLQRYKLRAGDTFNLNNGTSNVSPKAIGIDGRNTNFYINQPYN